MIRGWMPLVLCRIVSFNSALFERLYRRLCVCVFFYYYYCCLLSLLQKQEQQFFFFNKNKTTNFIQFSSVCTLYTQAVVEIALLYSWKTIAIHLLFKLDATIVACDKNCYCEISKIAFNAAATGYSFVFLEDLLIARWEIWFWEYKHLEFFLTTGVKLSFNFNFNFNMHRKKSRSSLSFIDDDDVVVVVDIWITCFT